LNMHRTAVKLVPPTLDKWLKAAAMREG
jgi:hypothetical protein